MLESLGRGDEAATHYERAALVRADTRKELWQPTRGHYRIHHHLRNGLRSRFDEDVIVPISSVLSLFAGLAMPDQVPAILNASARAEEQSGTNRSGISLTPPYPDDFFKSRHMPAWQYQNGGVWDWWGGLQIISEFEHGQSDRAIAHLTAASQAWENADGIHEWYHIPSHSSQGSDDFAGAAGTMAQAVIRGLFGVDITTNRFQLIPRLGNRNGRLLATRPDGSTLEIAQTVYPSLLFLDDLEHQEPRRGAPVDLVHDLEVASAQVVEPAHHGCDRVDDAPEVASAGGPSPLHVLLLLAQVVLELLVRLHDASHRHGELGTADVLEHALLNGHHVLLAHPLAARP